MVDWGEGKLEGRDEALQLVRDDILRPQVAEQHHVAQRL